jgi:hypothetical protein
MNNQMIDTDSSEPLINCYTPRNKVVGGYTGMDLQSTETTM